MAFSDNPIIDSNSKASEESVLYVKGVLSQKNRFISREEHPDFGADLDVELITEKNGASGRKFAVQIKSSIDLNYLSSDPYVSFSFKTSRLGYLCRRTPGFGLIVLYDSKTGVAYFDYVEEIYNRLIDEKGDDNWKYQKYVNIHVPIDNVLDKKTSSIIYSRINNRFNRVEISLGYEKLGFKLPILKKEDEEEIDFTDAVQISEALKKYGMQLLNSLDYDLLFDMLSKIPMAQVTSSNELIFLSAVTNSGVGKLFDADFFIKKCFSRINDYSADQQAILEQIKIQTDFGFGRFDNTIHLKKLEDLRKKETNKTNSLIIEMSIIRAKVMMLFSNELEVDQDLENEVLNLIDEIEDSDLDERIKHLLKLFHAENIGGLATKIFGESATVINVREEMNIKTPMPEKIEQAKRILEISNLPYTYFQNASNYAQENDDDLLYAYSLFCSSDYFLRQQFGIVALNRFEAENDFEESKKIFKANIKRSILAFNKLIELRRLRDALSALFTASELTKLFKYLYEYDLEVIETNKLQKKINSLSRELDIDPYESIIDDAFHHISNFEDNWSSIKDGDEINFAKIIVEATGLSKDRIPNIISDIKAYKLFEAKCNNPNLKLLQDLRHTRSTNTMYASKPYYILRDNSTGFESSPSQDIDELLAEYEHLLKKSAQ
jgi:hypothetical protein